MFFGEYRHNLDSKDRLTVPSRFREFLAQGAYVMRGLDRNLMVLPPTVFDTLAKQVSVLNLADPNTRLLRRLLFSGMDFIHVDNSGRILLPQFLRQHASLEGEVVVVGQVEYFEIWSPPLWDEQLARIQDAETNEQRFAAINLIIGS
jgi:MraZ protein